MDNYPQSEPNWEKVLAILHLEIEEATATLNAEEKALLAELKDIKEASKMFSDVQFDAEPKIENIKQRLDFRQKPVKYTLWSRIAITAAAVAAIVFGVWFYTFRSSRNEFGASAELVSGPQDIAPGKQGATLTLANGKKIRLTYAANGELAKEAGVSISKTVDGQVVYTALSSRANAKDPDPSGVGMTNVLSTAKGETYVVILPDNSKVWLNAASSLTYSAGLNERGLRRVKLEGEAYFEIAKDKKHPFIVQTRQQEVEVLGTHFNVNSYDNEPGVKTTLLEGSVRVRASLDPLGRGAEGGEEAVTLRPNQQSLITNADGIRVIEVDTELATAWKNNKFIFDQSDIQSIMRMVARWYNVEVIYYDELKGEKFGGVVSRFDHVSRVLRTLESTDKVHFKLQGRKIYVSK